MEPTGNEECHTIGEKRSPFSKISWDKNIKNLEIPIPNEDDEKDKKTDLEIIKWWKDEVIIEYKRNFEKEMFPALVDRHKRKTENWTGCIGTSDGLRQISRLGFGILAVGIFVLF